MVQVEGAIVKPEAPESKLRIAKLERILGAMVQFGNRVQVDRNCKQSAKV